ncbi:MAG TPA: tyrosine-type recombinase/integrase [Spirochaetia bacterium]|nr:tyrosine-type recombinase/integrase [Spirochaetia bacterium]
MAHFLAVFLASCKTQGRSEQALIGLRNRVPKLFAYLDESSLDLPSLRPRDAQGYIGWLSAQRTKYGAPYSGRTVAAYLSAASAFCEFAKRRGLVVSNLFKEVRRLRVEKKLPRGILKETQMKALLDALARFDEPAHLKAALARYRLHVIAELMYSTGLRVSEVASLAVSDIDFARSTVTVREGKGGWARVAFLNEFAREVLRLYVEKVRERAASEWHRRNDGLLFGTGWAWFGHAVNGELARACAELGLPAMRSHGFRHAVGFHLLRAGCNIRHIQSILGHRRLRNTEVYTRVDKEDLRHVVDACHPRRWMESENAVS